MRDNSINISQYQSKSSVIEKNTANLNLQTIFKGDNASAYLNEYTLYIAHFNAIPNVVPANNINCEKAQAWLIQNYGKEINDTHYCKRFFNSKKAVALDDVFYFLFDDVMIYLDFGWSTVKFLFRSTDMSKVNELIDGMSKIKKRSSNKIAVLSLLVNTAKGIDTKPLMITKPKLNISDNYNTEFLAIHQVIIKRLEKNNDKGLVLLHGKPGTGKTSYIRYLISTVKKKVIFLPPNMANAITNPDLISILIENPNSIFVIEDAENIIMDREKAGNSPVSALLNISDGLLADCLNIQIICSFNTDISKIDSALMRKGRLIAKYEFKELQLEKARQLSRKLGFKTQLTEPMTLASIYNQTEQDYHDKNIRPSIGFKVSA